MSAAPRKRRQLKSLSWYSLQAFMSREHRLLTERSATPRTKPTSARVVRLDREPDAPIVREGAA
jgi:hypothetical protein